MKVNLKKRGLLCAISLFVLISPLLSQSISGVIDGDVDKKSIRVSTNSSPELKKTSKRGTFSFKKADLYKDTLFFYENENAAPYYFSLGGLDDIKIYVKDSVITAKMKKRMPEISTFYGGNIITQEDLLATGEMTALAAVYRKFPSNSKTTFNGNTTPVYFVDGVETMDVSGIPVMEVAYIEYVKPTNPACASLGMRGANGIILFTTKTKYESSLSKEYFQPEREINIIRKFDAASELKKYSTITK